MSQVLTIGGTAYTSVLDKLSAEIGGKAANGERSVGTATLYDDTNVIDDDDAVKVWKPYTWVETATSPDTTLSAGRITGFSTQRDDERGEVQSNGVTWEVQFEDANAEAQKLACAPSIGPCDANGFYRRPAETDVERVLAIAADWLNGDPRASTVIDTSTYVPDANTVDMELKVYPPGTTPAEMLLECAGAADKEWFIDPDMNLHYDIPTTELYDAPIEISDGVGSHPAPDFSTYWPPIWDMGPAMDYQGQEFASAIVGVYAGDKAVYEEDATNIAAFDYVAEAINLDTETSGQAAHQVHGALRVRGRGMRSYQFTLRFRNDQVDKIKYGQRVRCHLSAAVDMDDTPQYRRVAELKWQPVGDGTWYDAHITLERMPRLFPGNINGGPTTPRPAPETTPDTPGTPVWHWSWDTSNNDDGTNTVAGGPIRPPTNPYYAPADAAFGAQMYGKNDAGHYHTAQAAISGNTAYTFSVQIMWQYNPGVRDVTIEWRNAANVLLRTDTFITGAGHGFNTVYTEAATFTSPATATTVVVSFTPLAGVYVNDLDISTAGTPATNDPYAVSDGGTSPYYARSDDPRFDSLASGIETLTPIQSTADPTVDDDEGDGYIIGQLWVNTTTDEAFVLVDNTTGAAVWDQIDNDATTSLGVTLQQTQINQRFPVWGHRGDIGSADAYPEESLEGLRQCALKGIQGAEIDVRLSSDSEWVLMHDSTVDRTTSSTGAVSSKTASTITGLTIDAGYGYDAGRHGSTIHPTTLAAVFDALNPYDFVLSIQLPSDISSDANATTLAQYVLDQGWAHRSLIEVSTLTAAAAIKAVSPLLTVEVNNTVSGADSDDNVDWLSMERATVTSLSVVTGKAPQHVKSYITINDFPADETSIIQDMWDRGVSAYQTDNVDFAIAARNALVYGGSFDEPTADAHIADTTDAHDASAISVLDTAGNFTATDVEAALAELADDIAALPSTSGIGEILISDTPSTPLIFADLIQNEAQDDLVYGDP